MLPALYFINYYATFYEPIHTVEAILFVCIYAFLNNPCYHTCLQNAERAARDEAKE